MLDYRGQSLHHENYHLYHHRKIHDDLLSWLSTIPLSRPVWHYGEDFADGILTADIIHHFFPQLINVDALHPARNMAQRTSNWHYLSSEVLPKIELYVPHMIVIDITNGVHCATELFLIHLRAAIQNYSIQIQKQSQSQLGFGTSNNIGNHSLSPGQTTERRSGMLPAITGTNSPRSTSNSPSGGKYTNGSRMSGAITSRSTNGTPSSTKGASLLNTTAATKSGLKGENGHCNCPDPLAPCREALGLKDKEIEELREKVKLFEKLLREKTNMYEKLIHTKDNRIQELQTRLEKVKVKQQ